MILRNKICIFALITSTLLFAIIYRHLAAEKLSILLPEPKFKPPPLEPNPHNTTGISAVDDPHPDVPEVEAPKTGHGHYDEKVGEKVWTKSEWLEETSQLWYSPLRSSQLPRKWIAPAVTEVCKRTKWRADLVFECLYDEERPRSALLTCLRYAIDVGAIVYVPWFLEHGKMNILAPWHMYPPTMPFAGQDEALRGVNQACPGLEVLPRLSSYRFKEGIESLGPTTRAPTLHPDDLPHWKIFNSSPVTSIRNYIKKLTDANKGVITVVPFGPVSNYYPVCTDHADFVDGFGDFVAFDGRGLHHQMEGDILWSLYNNYSIPLTPTSLTPSRSDFNNGRDKTGFLAIRFETPSSWFHDVIEREPTKVPSYDKQRDYFHKRLRDAKHGAHGLKVVYVSASRAIFDSFVRDSQREFGSLPGKRTFVRAQDLVSDRSEDYPSSLSGKEAFENMTPIEQDLVDYLVMLRAQYFVGIADSEISWAVATKRRVQSKTGSCGMRKPWTRWLLGSAMRDEWSDLMGGKKDLREDRMWP